MTNDSARLWVTLLFCGVALGSAPVRAADANSPESRLREVLRSTMLQLRQAEADRAALQAAQAENEKQKKDLDDTVTTLQTQLKDDKGASDKALADLNAKVAAQEAEIARYKDALDKWQKSYKGALDLAGTKEAQRAKLAADNVVLQRRVDDEGRRNAALLQVGNEILARYERFSLGDALTAREPFVGITRVKLKNLAQDYGDKLAAAAAGDRGAEHPAK